MWTSTFVASISAIVTIALVLITYVYMKQTKRMADTAQLSFLYERKPHLTFLLYNEDNKIFFSIKNNEKIISSAKNIDVELTLILDDQDISIGKYQNNGPLLPGENDDQEITHIILDMLREKKIIKSCSAETPDTDDGTGNFYFPTIHYLQKYEIEFKIHIFLSFELDIESITKKSFDLERNFTIRLNSDYGDSYYGPPDSDNYSTEIKMKMGDWIKSRDYFVEKTKKRNKKTSGVKGLI